MASKALAAGKACPTPCSSAKACWRQRLSAIRLKANSGTREEAGRARSIVASAWRIISSDVTLGKACKAR